MSDGGGRERCQENVCLSRRLRLACLYRHDNAEFFTSLISMATKIIS